MKKHSEPEKYENDPVDGPEAGKQSEPTPDKTPQDRPLNKGENENKPGRSSGEKNDPSDEIRQDQQGQAPDKDEGRVEKGGSGSAGPGSEMGGPGQIDEDKPEGPEQTDEDKPEGPEQTDEDKPLGTNREQPEHVSEEEAGPQSAKSRSEPAGDEDDEKQEATSGSEDEKQPGKPLAQKDEGRDEEDEDEAARDARVLEAGTDTDKSDEPSGDEPPDVTPEKPGKKDTVELDDYQNLEKEELLKALEEILDSGPVIGIREDVETIKVNFYKRHKAEIEQKRKRFMQEGGEVEAFDPGQDALEERFKELYRKYRHSKAAHNRNLEQTRQANLDAKLKVIEDLKELVSSTEDINRTFPEFRKLQKRWHEIGMVPQQNLKDLWDTYHHYVETFYDQIKINKELRDLDLKKNLEAKIELCEKAEELLLEGNIIVAFRKLQKLHDHWRETGPVPRDQKDAIWERFREITHQINKKHQEHFDNLKESHRKNLETKIALCEKAEAINEQPFENFQQVEMLTRQMVDLQRTWKTIGFAPKKDNTKIYQRFRNVCDRFFARKREFNQQNKEYLNENLQKKLDLCVQAETLKDSTDWKRTSEELISLQKKWKEIGPVPRKHYDPVWKRFRSACDHFFDKKSEHYSSMDSKYEENLKKKLELIEKIENFKFGNDLDASLNTLKEYQREWVSIGFVPIGEKEKVQKRYRAALDKHFEGLKVDENKKSLMKFRHKLEGVREKPRAFNKMKFEREKFLNRYKQLENDITLWENNIGFFAKSRSAEATIKEFREKIEQGKKQMALLEEKIKMIDEMDPDD